MSSFTRAMLCGFAFASLVVSQGSAQSPSPRTYQMSLSRAQVAVDGSKVMVTMEAAGDLRGLVTFTVNRAGDGAQVTGGNWAFAVRYVEYLDENGNVIDQAHAEPHDDTSPHAERPRFVDKGTVAGPVVSGQVGIDAKGVITGMDSVLLKIGSASLTFDGASGDGWSAVSGVQDADASSGTLTLTF